MKGGCMLPSDVVATIAGGNFHPTSGEGQVGMKLGLFAFIPLVSRTKSTDERFEDEGKEKRKEREKKNLESSGSYFSFIVCLRLSFHSSSFFFSFSLFLIPFLTLRSFILNYRVRFSVSVVFICHTNRVTVQALYVCFLCSCLQYHRPSR